jgi:hypothetical protein
MSAAPVRITVSRVRLLMTCITEENQLDFRFGLNLARTPILTGTSRPREENGDVSDDDVLDIDGVVEADIGRIELPQCSSLLTTVLS